VRLPFCPPHRQLLLLRWGSMLRAQGGGGTATVLVTQPLPCHAVEPLSLSLCLRLGVSYVCCIHIIMIMIITMTPHTHHTSPCLATPRSPPLASLVSGGLGSRTALPHSYSQLDPRSVWADNNVHRIATHNQRQSTTRQPRAGSLDRPRASAVERGEIFWISWGC